MSLLQSIGSTCTGSLVSMDANTTPAAGPAASTDCRDEQELQSAAILPPCPTDLVESWPLAFLSPPADLHGGGPLEAASAAIPAPFAAALATLTRFCSRARAGLILSEAGSRGGPAAPLPPCQGPPHSSAPAHPAPHTLSTPLPSLISPSPSTSTSTSPSPLTLLAASGHNPS